MSCPNEHCHDGFTQKIIDGEFTIKSWNMQNGNDTIQLWEKHLCETCGTIYGEYVKTIKEMERE